MSKTSRSKTHQHTVKKEIFIHGIGLHSGKEATLLIKPALPNTGILFVRKDLAQPVTIPASREFVTHTRLATTLGRGAVQISTVEHLLCAFKLMGVDNAVVEVSGPEVPIMDGSAEPFCKEILSAGIFEQPVSRKVAILKKKIEIRKGDKVATIEPSYRLAISARIEWSHPAIGAQNFSFVLNDSAHTEISMARTFGFLKDVEQLKKMGLALGGSYENAVVLDEEKILNEDGLRYSNEFVRHKILDAVGDIALSPIALLGDVSVHKAGHELHAELIQAVFSDPSNYEVVLMSELAEMATPSTHRTSHEVPALSAISAFARV